MRGKKPKNHSVHPCNHKIHLVDKCLLLFLLVLLLQAAYILFSPPASSAEAYNIDVIVRTSLSCIFGYFLSANFRKQEVSKDKQEAPPHNMPAADTTITTTSTITTTKPSAASIVSKETPIACASSLQITVATAIGLFCLVTLMVVRSFCENQLVDPSTSSFTASMSQFRDLLSGCMGFLTGCPSHKKEG